MPSLEPIPVPHHLRWREFKVRVLPSIVFCTVLVLAVFTWRRDVGPQGIVGQVEIRQTAVSTLKPGTIVRMLVQSQQAVNAGDPLAIVALEDPKLLETTLAVIRAETEAIRQSLDPIRPQQQILMGYERLRQDGLMLRAQLAVARIEFAESDSEYVRSKALGESQIIPLAELERLKSIRDAREAQVQELMLLVSDASKALTDSQPIRETISNLSQTNAIAAFMDVQEKKLRMIEAELGQIILTSPMEGVVGKIFRQVGDVVNTGDPILSVAAAHGENVVAYLRQPLRQKPSVGMPVEVRARSGQRPSVLARVESVGALLEPINPLLLPPGMLNQRTQELALPFRISIPRDFNVLPGETVDVVLKPQE
jgi:multidrug resistance efflux pump